MMDDSTAMESDGTTEPCPHCGAALAQDQRYCLECGAPRTYLSGMLLDRLRAPAVQLAQPLPETWQRGNVLTLIAGIGVLLLAMGVGVLIGRSGSSGSAGAVAPAQVIVATPTTGAAGAATAPTTPEATSTTASKTPSAKPKAKQAQPAGVGSVPSKPAPPAVLKNLHTGGSGGSYEQKSKNLPNVVETG
jgi:hypothetical protein